MWNEPVQLFGLGFSLTVSQLMVLIGFLGVAVGYLLAALVNRRPPSAEGGDKRTQDKERVVSNTSFMKGINYILSDKHDRAIEELTRAVSVDTETVETYVALGNLFRRNGEIDRAIRIRQSIIVRPNLDAKTRLQAEYDLGLDFRRGGFIDRAINAFEGVVKKDPKWIEPLQQLVQMYEETRDWEIAFQTREKVDRLTGGKSIAVLAHYQVEIGKSFLEKGQPKQANASYKKALTLDPTCVDAYLHLGDLQIREGHPKKAIATWRKVVDTAPQLAYLTFGRLARAAQNLKDLRPVEEFLDQTARGTGSPLAHLALARLTSDRGNNERAVTELKLAIELDGSLIEARRELGRLLLEMNRPDEAIEAFRMLLDNMAGLDVAFQCGRCGFEFKELMWLCPQCHAWDTMALKRNRPLLFSPARSGSAELPKSTAPEPAVKSLEDAG